MPPRPKTSREATAKATFAQTFRAANTAKLQELVDIGSHEEVPSSERAFREELDSCAVDDGQNRIDLQALEEKKVWLGSLAEALQKYHTIAMQEAEDTVVPQLGTSWQEDFEKLATVAEAGRIVAAKKVDQVLQRKDTTTTHEATDQELRRQAKAAELLGLGAAGEGQDTRKKERDILADAARGVVRLTKGLSREQPNQ